LSISMLKNIDIRTLQSRRDFRKTLFHLAIPIFLETFLRMMLVNVNVLMLSKLSDQIVGAVGVANQIINFAIMLYAAVAFGVAVIISQNLGAGNKKVAMDTSNIAIIISIVFGIILGFSLILSGSFLLTMMRVPTEMMGPGVKYLQIVGGASVFQSGIGVLSAISRNYRFTRIPMAMTLGMNILNVIGNMVVIYRPFNLPEYGIVGIGVSTAISQGLTFFVMLILIYSHDGMNLKFSIPKPFPWKTIKKIISIGIPGGGDSLFYTLMMIMVTFFITGIGSSALTAFVYLSSLISFIQITGFSIGQATMIQTGHLVGAEKNNEAILFARRSYFLALSINSSICLLFFLISKHLMAIFTDDPVIIAIGVSVFVVDLFVEPMRPFSLVIGSSLRATGDVVWPVIASAISLWGICVPLAWLFSTELHFGLPGIYAAFAIDEFVRGGLMVLRWRSGIWKKKRVVETPATLINEADL